MQTEVFSQLDQEQAEAIWADYQTSHDLSALMGQAAGVDPRTGEVFFGRTAGEIIDRLRGEGQWRPLFVFRVGRPYYARLRGRRLWSEDH